MSKAFDSKAFNNGFRPTAGHQVTGQLTSCKETAYLSEFGRMMQEKRRQHGVSIIDLAERLRTCPQYIDGIERGDFRPSLDMCNRIARVLRMNRDHALLAAGYVPADVLLILRAYPNLCETLRQRRIN